MYPHYRQAVADPMRAYASLFFRMYIFVLLWTLTNYYHVASSERSKWALPGTELLYQQDKHELSALRNSLTTPWRLATTPSPTSARTRSVPNTLHRQAIHRNFQSNPPDSPSQTPTRTNSQLASKFGGDGSDGVDGGDDYKIALDTGNPSNTTAAYWEAQFSHLVSNAELSNDGLCSLYREAHY